jgi:hypothetical protein
VSGIVSVATGLHDQRRVPDVQNIGSLNPENFKPAQAFLPYSEPASIDIPAVSIKSTLITVGKTPSGSIAVPEAPDFDKAAWYRYSPTPGQYGVSIIVGHVDSFANDDGASIFYNLPNIKPGQKVSVTRADGSVASFTVYALRQYDKATLPSGEVYDTKQQAAELRLITCSGPFDTASGTYRDNTVIFARLTD